MHTLNIRRSLRSFGIWNWLLLAALLVAVLMTIAATSSVASAQVLLSVTIAPPPLVVYAQPICPAPGYIWTPGYWSYDYDGGYFWVPGTWVLAPEVGFLWTPGYWGWSDGAYIWNVGYWGPDVGFYGGIDYGYGYIGVGYEGGYWNGGQFFYNTRVNHVDVTVVHNVYQRTVVDPVNTVSYNGGNGGVQAQPTPRQQAFANERHIPPAPVQRQHEVAARSNRSQFVAVNHGHPPVAATPKPGVFQGRGVVAARGAPSNRVNARNAAPNGNAAANRSAAASRNAAANRNAATNRSAAANSNPSTNRNVAT